MSIYSRKREQWIIDTIHYVEKKNGEQNWATLVIDLACDISLAHKWQDSITSLVTQRSMNQYRLLHPTILRMETATVE